LAAVSLPLQAATVSNGRTTVSKTVALSLEGNVVNKGFGILQK
jgi:hypothetical protein